MEKRGDPMLFTLRSCVWTMGVKLNLVVEFPGRAPPVRDGLGDTEDSRRVQKQPAPAP